MKASDVLEYSLSDFTSNKFKTTMSSLGIIIGVMAIVVMMSLSDGVYAGVSQQFGNLDVNQMILVPAGLQDQSGMGMSFGIRQTEKAPARFTERDLRIIESVPGIIEVNQDRRVGHRDVQQGKPTVLQASCRPPKRAGGDPRQGPVPDGLDRYMVVVGAR
jgi:putative ABC transport system permease protein